MQSVFSIFVRFSILLLVVAFLTGCELKSPQAPSWDLDLQIPLINKTYSAGELLERISSDNIKVDSNGVGWFSLQQSLDSIRLDQILKFGNVGIRSEEEIGRIRIPTPQTQAAQLAMADHLPLIAGFVPDTGLWADVPLDEPGSFQEATFQEGEMTIRVANNTGFDLDSLICVLSDLGGGETVFTEPVPGGLAIGGTSQSTIPLDGKSLSNNLGLSIYFHTPGGSALSLAGREITVSLDFSDSIYVSNAVAAVEQLESHYSESIALSTTHKIELARLCQGRLSFSFHNNLPLATGLQVTLPGVTSDVLPLTFDLSAGPGATSERQIDLSGYQIRPNRGRIEAEIDAIISSSYGQYVTIRSSDQLSFDFLIADIGVSSAEAAIAPTEIAWEEQNVQLEIPEGLQNASLTEGGVVVEIENASELSGEVELRLQSSRGQMIALSGSVVSGSRELPSISQLHSDQLQQFLSPVPMSLSIAGTASVGDGQTIVSISGDDFLTMEVRILSPLVFQLDPSIVESDIRKLEFAEEIRDPVDRLHRATITTAIINHLPLGAALTLYFSTDSVTLYGKPAFTVGPVACDQAQVGSNGWVAAVTTTNNVLELTSVEIETFAYPVVYVGSIIALPGTGNQPVEIRADDFLQILSSLQVSGRVGGE